VKSLHLKEYLWVGISSQWESINRIQSVKEVSELPVKLKSAWEDPQKSVFFEEAPHIC
jgi:hypothetical protein